MQCYGCVHLPLVLPLPHFPPPNSTHIHLHCCPQAPAAAAEPLTEYEQQRLRNIERNKQVLASIRARE